MRWHYSKCLPASKSQYIGVWEHRKFIGTVIFGCGAGRITEGKQYDLPMMRMAELMRVALAKHETPVSRIVAIAIKMVKNKNPKLRLLVSLADPFRGHVGAIYQAGGWLYVGQTGKTKIYIDQYGKEHHNRIVSSSGWKKQFTKYVRCLRPNDAISIRTCPGKHKYLMPLDEDIRKRLSSLAKPYPKRAGSKVGVASVIHTEEGGSIPTPALNHK